MTTNERRQSIVQILKDGDGDPVRINDIVKHFNVTPATIRRDLCHLEKSGVVLRTHGAAQLIANNTVPGYIHRNEIFSDEKLAIAKIAAQMVKPGETVVLDTGTTTQAIANQLSNRNDITLITNSVSIATSLADTKLSTTTMLSGGYLYGRDLALIGPEAEATFNKFSASIVFLGTTGIRSCEGMTTFSSFQASVKQSMIKCAKKRVLVADASKFKISGLVMFANFSEINTFITTGPIEDPDFFDRMNELNVEVIIATP